MSNLLRKYQKYDILTLLPGRLPAQAGLMVEYQMWYVYILKSYRKKWYYVGSSNDLVRRIKEHNLGRVVSTKAYVPFELIYSKQFTSENEARSYEKRIKDQRILKENIIKNLK